MERPVDLADKTEILLWMEKHCHGFRNAKHRDDILPFILISRAWDSQVTKDRYFRKIASELVHEGHLASSHKWGYWFIPLHTRDIDEINAIMQSFLERKKKALSMLADVESQIKHTETMMMTVTQGQQEFASLGA